ncbi:MAG TPA: very short patch repair endonuclease [Longimicrobiales bacterium]|nr:very short patch repair endonuclease [Longimicrobiales bacterium]
MNRDRLSKERRSWNMSRIRSKNTSPEMRVRSLLHRMGYRFRLHVKNLPGRPDIVLPRYRTVIFVHGCFWHRHKGCKNCTTPTNRREWWLAKLDGNAARDKLHQAALRNSFWESAERMAVRVGDDSVGMKRYRNDVFLDFNGVLEFALAIEELLKASDLAVHDLALRLQFGVEDHVTVLIRHQRHGTIAEGVDVNAEAATRLGWILAAHCCASTCLRMDAIIAR